MRVHGEGSRRSRRSSHSMNNQNSVSRSAWTDASSVSKGTSSSGLNEVPSFVPLAVGANRRREIGRPASQASELAGSAKLLNHTIRERIKPRSSLHVGAVSMREVTSGAHPAHLADPRAGDFVTSASQPMSKQDSSCTATAEPKPVVGRKQTQPALSHGIRRPQFANIITTREARL